MQGTPQRLSANALSAVFAGTRGGANRRGQRGLIPIPGTNRCYGSHRVRHLIERLAHAVGNDLVDATPEWDNRIMPQIHADSKLGHSMRADALGYLDGEARRGYFCGLVSLGRRDLGVPGILDLLFGDDGARRGWHEEAIRAAVSARQGARDASAAAEEIAARCEADADALRRTPLVPAIPDDVQDLSETEARSLMLRRDAAREQRERALHDAWKASRDARERAVTARALQRETEQTLNRLARTGARCRSTTASRSPPSWAIPSCSPPPARLSTVSPPVCLRRLSAAATPSTTSPGGRARAPLDHHRPDAGRR